MSFHAPLRWVRPEKIKTLYWDKGYSSRQIAPFYNVSHRAILKYMKKNSIPRRPPYRMPLTRKYPFSGDCLEKVYLLGLRATDLYVTLHRRQIQVSLTGLESTLNAFRRAFEKYAPVKLWGEKKYVRSTKRYVYTYLDKSFKFLISKPQEVPKWIINDDEFYAFFAGCVDGDGAVKAYPRFRSFYLGVYNSNLNFLQSLKQWLKKLGYHPGLFCKKQNTKQLLVYRYNDLWRLIPHLLRYMRHTERVKKI